MDLPDVQKTSPSRERRIHKVGVEDVEVGFTLSLRDGTHLRDINASVNMYADLDEKTKGVSMSRFIRTLVPYLGKPLKKILIFDILTSLKERIGCEDIYLSFKFKLPRPRKSPKSDYEFPIFHDCLFEGRMINDEYKFYQGVRVFYASYCPCSCELVKHLQGQKSNGYPHAQRSYTDILIEGDESRYIWLEDLIDLAEKSVKVLPYPIIKRVDEQEIARQAYNSPMFVEDVIREITHNLEGMEGVLDYYVKCVHMESIHTSNAVAISYRLDNGLHDISYFKDK